MYEENLLEEDSYLFSGFYWVGGGGWGRGVLRCVGRGGGFCF